MTEIQLQFYDCLFLWYSSNLPHSGVVGFPACMASPAIQGYQAVMDVMAVKEPEVTKEARERLGPRDLLE